MRKQSRKAIIEAHLNHQGSLIEDSVENSKRRYMMSMVSGDVKFFERILMMKRAEDLTFFSKSSARNR